MIPKLVIFDCDGVLVDSEPITAQIIAADLTAHGLPVSPTEVDRLFTGGTMRGVGEIARAEGADLPDDWLKRINEKVFAALAKGVDVLPGLMPLLDALEARGVAVAVASNGPMAKMAISLGPSGLFKRFEGRIYSGHDFAPKPAPDMLVHACKITGVALTDAVLIDDSPTGCRAALNAGVPCIGLDTHGDGAHLAAVGARPIRSFAELAALWHIVLN